MGSKSRLVLLAVLPVIALAVHSADGWTQEKKAPAKDEEQAALMKKKLSQAQKFLEGLAQQDFDKIKSAADELASLRRQAAWSINRSPEYDVFSNDFQRNIDAAQQAASNKNIDAAALAYIEMTMTCVKCHKYVREQGKKQPQR